MHKNDSANACPASVIVQDDVTVADLPLQEAYPFWRVVLIYGFGGGAAGGCLLALLGMVLALVSPNSPSFSASALLILVIFGFFGMVGGFVPALLTGIVVGRMQARRDGNGLFGAALCGGIISWLYFSLLSGLSAIVAAAGLALLGAITAWLLGFLALPPGHPEIVVVSTKHSKE